MEKTVLSSSYLLRFTSNTQKKHNNTIQKIYTIGWDEAVVLSFCVLFHYLNDPFFIFFLFGFILYDTVSLSLSLYQAHAEDMFDDRAWGVKIASHPPFSDTFFARQ